MDWTHGHLAIMFMLNQMDVLTLTRFVPHVLKHEKVFGASLKTLCPQKLQKTYIVIV